MISVTRLDGNIYWINPHMIESMEKTPDLTITFLSGKKVVVKDSPEELIQRIVSYRRRLEISSQEL
ncbi:MAG: flagellar FlbD family protein [Spirochaetia bacterium]|uniref:flagellar FlbD family protein n=1 Tax=Treponema berlinense TaxID=225004 RepID=UPI0015BCA54F|nr:flagellar FlbD family protein [Treponema berlinense]MDD5790323.1 flagellar FlbD family protein [Spirochaetia bacterium]